MPALFYQDTWALNMYRALNIAMRRQRRIGEIPIAFPFKYEGFVVYHAEPLLPFGRSTSARGWLTHMVTDIYVVWHRGNVYGAGARWRCGARSNQFRLLEEPDSTECAACPINRPPRRRVNA